MSVVAVANESMVFQYCSKLTPFCVELQKYSNILALIIQEETIFISVSLFLFSFFSFLFLFLLFFFFFFFSFSFSFSFFSFFSICLMLLHLPKYRIIPAFGENPSLITIPVALSFSFYLEQYNLPNTTYYATFDNGLLPLFLLFDF